MGSAPEQDSTDGRNEQAGEDGQQQRAHCFEHGDTSKTGYSDQ
jgi:hypothetical protein